MPLCQKCKKLPREWPKYQDIIHGKKCRGTCEGFLGDTTMILCEGCSKYQNRCSRCGVPLDERKKK